MTCCYLLEVLASVSVIDQRVQIIDRLFIQLVARLPLAHGDLLLT